ncbi:MAG: hypothetical protein CV087_23825 [Candidatus Brocadia sp. WS118]|nr:MAG: hypothetical protein CV087_23825 [Candidatus Brocadia sp. WS118]
MSKDSNSKKRFLKPVLFGVAGAVLGFSYYYFIGCQSGTCPITSNPYISTAYGMLMGVVLGVGGKSAPKEKTEKE